MPSLLASLTIPARQMTLDFADNDAQDMYLALTSVYGFHGENVRYLVDIEGIEANAGTLVATRENILIAIDELRDRVDSSDDEAVLFFSGHGMRGVAADGDSERVDEAIVVHDGTEIVPIWDGELRAAFASFATSRIIFMFDTCLAGGMKKDLEAEGRVIAMATTSFRSVRIGMGRADILGKSELMR